jgi:hypothetical protein
MENNACMDCSALSEMPQWSCLMIAESQSKRRVKHTQRANRWADMKSAGRLLRVMFNRPWSKLHPMQTERTGANKSLSLAGERPSANGKGGLYSKRQDEI